MEAKQSGGTEPSSPAKLKSKSQYVSTVCENIGLSEQDRSKHSKEELFWKNFFNEHTKSLENIGKLAKTCISGIILIDLLTCCLKHNAILKIILV